VFVGPGQSARVEFDLRPRDCPVDVHVLRRGVPAAEARVVLRGDPESLRRAREGAVRLSLPPGRYRIAVGHEDRVSERDLVIETLDGQTLTFDLDDLPSLVFRSCETAVMSYLQGDDLAAANALERAGQRNVAHLLRAETHRARGEFEPAAIHYEAAGKLLEAAEVHTEAGACERAAVLFERAGDPVRAAEMHQAAGDLVRAARCFEEADDLEQAVECYREAGAIPKLIDVLEKVGDHFEAGRLAHEREETNRAVRNLQQVDPRHPEYTRACRILAETFVEDDKIELAVQKADEAITFANDDDVTKETFVWYGNLLDRAGRTERALRVFQDLAERETDDDDIRSRIHQIEEKYSKEQIHAAQGQGGAEPGGGGAGRELKRYEVLEEIGRGGMGIVFKARDRRLGRIVALKRMPDNLKDHPRAVELFLREARSAAALNHPNIVTVHDVDQDDGVYILTMELLKGAPFHLILKKRGRLSAPDVARLGIQIAQGLDYAHKRGIVHRDVKTANLFFTNDKVVKIMDFGLAKMLDELRRSATQVTGTPYYMAPEQVTGVGVDHRVDLYAFGVTLFELLTGNLPFTDGDILFQHKEAPPPDPRELNPAVPESLAKLVLKLMSKQAPDRGESGAEVAAALQRIADSLLAK
jgi:tRNA A-37 threonylcarbamoyl transferase component Bud32/Tfp pilus assembly protein PilF